MKQIKRVLALAFVGTSLFAGMATAAKADDDGWGRFPINVVVGIPAYGSAFYVAPPPPPPPVEYRYYGPSPSYYYGRTHYYWHDHRHWEHHDEGDDD